jgi:hypothetical protein
MNKIEMASKYDADTSKADGNNINSLVTTLPHQ